MIHILNNHIAIMNEVLLVLGEIASRYYLLDHLVVVIELSF